MLQTLTKLYVRNLPITVDTAELENLFSNVGDVVRAQIVDDSAPGPLRGYVEMATPHEAALCIERFNGQNYQGHVLIVTEDKPHVPQPKKATGKRAQVAPRKRGTDPVSLAIAAQLRADIISSRK